MTNSNPPGREPWTSKPDGDGEKTPAGDGDPTLGKPETPDAEQPAADQSAQGTESGGEKTPEPTPEQPMPAEAESEAAAEATDTLEATEKLDYEPTSPEIGEAEARDRSETEADIEPAAAEPPPEREPETEQKKGGGALLWVIAVLLALGIGGYFTWPTWSPQIAEYIPQSIRDQSWFPAIPGEEPETAAVDEEAAGAPAPEAPTQAEPTVDTAPEAPAAEQADTEPAAPDAATPEEAVTEETVTEAPAAEEAAEVEVVDVTGAPAEGEDTEAPAAEEAAEVEVVDVTGAPAEGEDAAAPTATAALAAAVQNVTQRLGSMQDQIAATRQDLSGLATQVEERTVALRDRLGELETRTETIEQSTVTVLAINNLETAADSGNDFSSQLARVKDLVGDDAAIADALANLAANAGGVPTRATLKSAFPDVRDAIVRTSAGAEEGDWVDRLVARLRGLYTFRSPGEGDPAAAGFEGAVARAQQALADGDLATAVSEVQGIEGPEAARKWLSDAQSRLAVDESIARVRENALTRLTSKTGS